MTPNIELTLLVSNNDVLFLYVLQVCKDGATLTPEQASILKLLGIQLAEFKVVIKCHWTKGKGFIKDLDVPSDDDNDDAVEDEVMEEDET